MVDLGKTWLAIWSPRQAVVGVEMADKYIDDVRRAIDRGERPDWVVLAISDVEADVRTVAKRMQARRALGEFPPAEHDVG